MPVLSIVSSLIRRWTRPTGKWRAVLPVGSRILITLHTSSPFSLYLFRIWTHSCNGDSYKNNEISIQNEKKKRKLTCMRWLRISQANGMSWRGDKWVVSCSWSCNSDGYEISVQNDKRKLTRLRISQLGWVEEVASELRVCCDSEWWEFNHDWTTWM
jgi:hypothetical protein